jgi:hypothetical protein
MIWSGMRGIECEVGDDDCEEKDGLEERDEVGDDASIVEGCGCRGFVGPKGAFAGSVVGRCKKEVEEGFDCDRRRCTP